MTVKRKLVREVSRKTQDQKTVADLATAWAGASRTTVGRAPHTGAAGPPFQKIP